MSDHYLLCNSAKREYFDMEVFGDSARSPYSYDEAYLYPFALVRLCAMWPGDNLRGHWQGDRLDFVSINHDDYFDQVVETYRSITLDLLDSLCERDEGFIREILRRGMDEHVYNMPVSSALLTLLDDPQYKHFRHCGRYFHNEYSDHEKIPEGAGDRWESVVASLREHYVQYYRGLNAKPPDDPRMHFR